MNSAVILGFALSLALGGTAVAQEATQLSAPDSTPDALGLMQGFPPAARQNDSLHGSGLFCLS